MLKYFDRENTIASPEYNRWLVPPAALAIHLSIGQAYSFSVFNIPLTQVVGVTHSAPEDWKLSTVTWIFSLAFIMLGLSAALFGKWLERVGPRKAMIVATLCFAGGFLISALGVHFHQIALLYLGYGLLGGIGLGLGYISPVSTLMKWFPDKPGMATGLAIMGFGGGALIGSPLALTLMNHFKSEVSNGVLYTFLTMGLLYFLVMLFGVVTIRLPSEARERSTPSSFATGMASVRASASSGPNVSVEDAVRTKQFWFLWLVLCTNVTAGIAVLSQASPMIQEMFSASVTPAAAAGFVGLLSLFNLGGRFLWSSFSDVIGRKKIYMIYFGLGLVLYSLLPSFGKNQQLVPFVLTCGVIISMYGGGFATIPAYLKDIFGLYNVGAIHGRLLTAWSTAGALGPALITYIKEQQVANGVPVADSYSFTIYVMLVVLAVGFIANYLVQPLVEAKK